MLTTYSQSWYANLTKMDWGIKLSRSSIMLRPSSIWDRRCGMHLLRVKEGWYSTDYSMILPASAKKISTAQHQLLESRSKEVLLEKAFRKQFLPSHTEMITARRLFKWQAKSRAWQTKPMDRIRSSEDNSRKETRAKQNS